VLQKREWGKEKGVSIWGRGQRESAKRGLGRRTGYLRGGKRVLFCPKKDAVKRGRGRTQEGGVKKEPWVPQRIKRSQVGREDDLERK